MRNVLLLSDTGVVIGAIDWTCAMTMILNQNGSKVIPIAYYGDDVVVHSPKQNFPLPSVIMLRYRKDRRIPYNKSLAITKANVLARDDYVCQYCGDHLTLKDGTIDHVVPQSRGGKHAWENVVASCMECNNQKNDMFLKEAGKRHSIVLKRKPKQPHRNTFLKKLISRPEYACWKDYVAV